MYVRYALAFLTAAAMGLTVFVVQESGVFRGNVSSINSSFNDSWNTSSYSASSESCYEMGTSCQALDGVCCDGGACRWTGSDYTCVPAVSSAPPSCGTEGDECFGTGDCCDGYACGADPNVCRWVGSGTTGGDGGTGGSASSEPSDPVCGNGDVEDGEACDDGNGVQTDACTNGCETATCGDSYVRNGFEQCDDGNTSLTDSCASCQNARCGDGHVRAGVEQCDDGNALNNDACVASCKNAFCGDGFVRAGVEQCDDGNANNADACSNACTIVAPPASSSRGSSKAPTPSSSRAASSSSQCAQTCTGADLLYVLSGGLFGNAGTCTTTCGGSSSAPVSSPKSSAASSAPAGVCCKIKTDEAGYQEGVVACMFTATRAACETVPANKWLPGETSLGTCQTTCLLPDLKVNVSLAGTFGDPKEEPIEVGGITTFSPMVYNQGEGVAKNVTTTVTLASPLKPEESFVAIVNNGTCTINASRSVITCTTPSLAPGASFAVTMLLTLPANASPMPACSTRMPATVSTSTTTTEIRTDNNSQTQNYFPNCGVCCPDPDSGVSCTSADHKPKASCDLTNPFYTPTWLPSPNTCANCPKASSSSSSAAPKKVCCIYDRNSTSNGQWNVLGCELRPQKSAVLCHDVIAEPDKWGEWRDDIPENSCNASTAQQVCGKGGVDLKLTKTYEGSSQPKVGDEMPYELEVTNVTNGDTAVDVTVNDFRNPNLQFVRAAGAECSVLGISQAVSCDLGSLAARASKKFTLVFKLLDRGTSGCTVTNTALVYADNKELMISDNYANAPTNAYCVSGTRYCCAPSANSCSQVSLGEDGKCPSYKPGTLEAGYDTSTACDAVCKAPTVEKYCCSTSNTCSKVALTDGKCPSPIKSGTADTGYGTKGPCDSACAIRHPCCMKIEIADRINPEYVCGTEISEQACKARIGTTVSTSFNRGKVIDVAYKGDVEQCQQTSCRESFIPKPCCSSGIACELKLEHECKAAGGRVGTGYSCSDPEGACKISSSKSSVPTSTSSAASSSSSAAPVADISIKKTLAPVAAGAKRKPGDKVTYTITVTNHGDVEATGVKISDLFPYGLDVISMPSNCTDIPGLLRCNGIAVPARGSTDITIEATIDEPPSLCGDTYGVGENRVSVSAPPQFDKNSSNNIADVPGFRIDCPTWEVKKEFVTTGAYAKGQTVKFKLSFKRIGGKYTPNGSGYDNDYFEDVGSYLDFATLPPGCVLSDAGNNARKLACQFPPVAKDATHTVEVVGTIKQTVCDSGNAGKFSNAVTVKRGRFTASDKLIGTSSVSGAVDCNKEEVKYCCSDNKCVEKKEGVTCASDTEYPGLPSDCGGACGGTPKYCCTTGNQCDVRGAAGVSCKDSISYAASGCNNACPPAPKRYCCTESGNQCAQVVGGTACKEGSVPGTDANCGGLCKPAPVKAFCCTAAANSCATEQTLTNGKCLSPKAGKSESGYETAASCESACNGGWRVIVTLETEGEVRVGQKATFTVMVVRTGAAYDATTGSAKVDITPDFISDMEFSQQACALNADGTGTCTLPSMSKDGNFDLTVTGTVAAGACANKLGKINLVARTEGVEDSAPSDVKCETGRGGCCAKNLLDDDMACNFNLSEDDCDDIAGQTWHAESCESKCGTVPVSACAQGCFPALANGTCPADPGMMVRAPTTAWGKLVAWLTGAPLKADLLDVGGGCCCPSGGGTTGGDDGTGGGTGSDGGDGGSAGSVASTAASATSKSSSSAARTDKQCGVCSGASKTACESGPNLCQWKGSAFGFVTVLFGGSSGTCAPAPQCLSGGTSSMSKASASSSVSSKQEVYFVIGLLFRSSGAACLDGIDNDKDGRTDDADPGCYDAGSALEASLASRLLAAIGLSIRPEGTYMPERNSELCDSGMYETEGKCVALPSCPAPTGDANRDRANVTLSCVTQCGSNSRCAGLCSCNCVAGASDVAMAQMCFNTCLSRESHPECAAAANGRTAQGRTTVECCSTACVGQSCSN